MAYRFLIINRDAYTEQLQSLSVPDIHTAIGHATEPLTAVKVEESSIPEGLDIGITEEQFKILCGDPNSGWTYIGDE